MINKYWVVGLLLFIHIKLTLIDLFFWQIKDVIVITSTLIVPFITLTLKIIQIT